MGSRFADPSPPYAIVGFLDSCVFLAIAVTNLRGENRTLCATNQFFKPEITTGLPAIIAR